MIIVKEIVLIKENQGTIFKQMLAFNGAILLVFVFLNIISEDGSIVYTFFGGTQVVPYVTKADKNSVTCPVCNRSLYFLLYPRFPEPYISRDTSTENPSQ